MKLVDLEWNLPKKRFGKESGINFVVLLYYMPSVVQA